MKKKYRFLLFTLLVLMLCLTAAVASAYSIEGTKTLALQINLPTGVPAVGGFYSKGCDFYTSFEPTSTRTWTATPTDGGPALQMTPSGTGKDSKKATLNLVPGQVYSVGGPYQYTVKSTLNEHEVSTDITVYFVDSLPADGYSLFYAKVTGSSTTEAPLPLVDGTMEMIQGETYVLTEDVPMNHVFNGFLVSNPDEYNNEWEEVYDFPVSNSSTESVFKAKINGTYAHSFTISYYAMYAGHDCGTNLACHMPYNLEISTVLHTISFEMNGGSVAFDVSWPGHTQGEYPPAWPMEDVKVGDGKVYTVPECTIIPPDWKMFDHWEATAGNVTRELTPGDTVTVNNDMVFTPIWVDRTFSAAYQIGTLTQGVDDPPSFFVHNFLIPYIPADMVPYTARGNKDPYERNIQIRWYRVENGERVELVSQNVFMDPSEIAPGGAYFQAMAPGEVGDYELVIVYKGTEVLRQFWSMLEGSGQAGGHSYEMVGSLDKAYDGEPVSFDPDKMLVIDKGTTSWGDLGKDVHYTWKVLDGKEYIEIDDAPVSVGQYQLVILELGDKGFEEAAVFPFEIGGSVEPSISLSVSPAKPVIGEPFVISWEIHPDTYQTAGLSGLIYIGDMLKAVSFDNADVMNNPTGSVTLTLTEGEDIELRLWADEQRTYEIVHLTGNTLQPIQATVSYQKSSVGIGEKIVADYAITGGSGEYETINASWYWMDEQWNSEELSKKNVSGASGELEYTPTQAGKIGLVFSVKDRDGWMFDQDVFNVNTVTVSEKLLVLPRDLTRIETEAFLNVAATEIDIPDGVEFIGANAFPSGVTLIVGDGTYAEGWARDNGYTPVVR